MGHLGTSMMINSVDDRDVVFGMVNRKDLPSLNVNFRVVHVFVLDGSSRLRRR